MGQMVQNMERGEMKIVQVHLLNKETGEVEVFSTDNIPNDEYVKYKLFALFMEDGSTIGC